MKKVDLYVSAKPSHAKRKLKTSELKFRRYFEYDAAYLLT